MAFNFEFKKEHLRALIGNNPKIDEWYAAMCEVLPKYEITTKSRVASFVAQCSHESAKFTAIKENLNYGAKGLQTTFKKYFPDEASALLYERKPEKIANKVYGGRMGNGLEASGDGFKYCGRGLIQLTGKENYTKFAASINKTLDETIAYLGTTAGAVESACWFWDTNKLNVEADNADITKMTKKINGGTNGLAERIENYKHAMEVLGAT